MRLASAVYGTTYPFDEFGMFTEFTGVYDPADLQGCDALVVWGGEDISPTLYGQKVHRMTGAKSEPSIRDKTEWALMKEATRLGIPIIGICRGAQMLCALAGGSLYQHVNNHGVSGGHLAECEDGSIIRVSSLHHQMMNVAETDHKLIAWSDHVRSDVHLDDSGDHEVLVEPEYVYFPKVKGHAIQWHPEYQNARDAANTWLRDRWQRDGL